MNRLFIILGLVTAVSLFAGGYWLGKRGEAPQVVEASRSYSNGAERAEELHKVVVTERTRTTKKPDGTVVTDTSVVKEDSASHITQSEREKAQETSKVTQALPQYGLGLSYQPSQKVWGVEASRRLVGPLWGTVQVDQRLGFQLGIRLEF